MQPLVCRYPRHNRMFMSHGSVFQYTKGYISNLRAYKRRHLSFLTFSQAARCLRRALDQKVRKLRTMLTADEDITTELDRVVCKLMKLALRTSRRRHSPPPTRWMQCKLLDLLTLTEKAIERRKRYFIENYPLKSIGYDDPSEKSVEMLALEKIREDDTALKIVNKYRHLVQTEKTGVEESRAKYRFIDMELEDDLSATSAEFLKDYEYIDRHSPSLFEPEPTLTDMALFDPDSERTKIERTQAWLEDDLEVVSYPQHDLNFDNEISSGDTEHSTSLTRYYKKSYKKYKTKKQGFELKCVICKKSHSKVVVREHKNEKKVKDKTSKTKVIKKVSKKKSSYNNLFKDTSNKHGSVDYRNYRVKQRKHEYKSSQPTASKPIPASLIELCHPELMIQDNLGIYKEHIINFTRDDVEYNQLSGGVSATEKSLLIDIVMDDIQETIAMKRTIGTDAEGDPMGYENETLIRSVSNTAINDDHFFDKHDVGIENDQTIFLNDINEPSTSKGIRHVSMDVQCGPDASAPKYSILSTTTSITRMPSIFTAGIKIGDSSTDTKMDSIDSYTDTKLEKKSTDCCTSTDNDEGNFKTIAPRERTVGIKIKESIPNMIETLECSTMTLEHESSMIQKLEPIRRQGSTKIPRPESPLYKKQESPGQELRSNLLQRKESSRHRQETSIKQKRKPPSPKQESPSPRLGTNIKQSQESPSRQQESSAIQQESPSRQQGSSAIQQELPSRQQESSAIQQESPSRQQESSAIQQELPSRQQKSSAIQQESPVQRQETTTMQKPESPIQSLELTANRRQESPIRGQVTQREESPIRKHESSEIHRQESPVRKNESSEIQRQDSPRRERDLTTQEQEVTIMQASNILQKADQTLTGEPESDRTDASSPLHTDIETKCLKSIPSGMKIDSGSEFCGSFSSIPKSLANCLDINLKLISSGTKDVAVSRKLTRYVRPKLCCGGVQVHSYRDLQTSEDVMYQGEWQNPRPKVLTKRKIYNPVTVKRITDSALKKKVSSKEKIPVKSIVKQDIKRLQKLTPTGKIQPTKMKPNLEKKECIHSSIPKCVAKVNRPMRNVTKVPSKLTMGSATSKNSKSAFVVKKPQKTGESSTKEEQKTKTNLNKEYLPYYLRRHALKPPTKEDNKLNLSLDSAKSNLCKKTKTPKPLVRSKTEEIKQELLKFQNKVPKQNYIVLRNEVEKTGSANDGQPAKATADSGRRRGASKRTLSPQSQNSSTCSSPNSIATVRAVSIRTKNVTSRRHSTSSYKTSTANSGSENTTPNRNKKYTKRSKSAKMSDEKTFDNKENIPQTSRQSNIVTKASDKNTKGAFLGQQKEVFIAQLKETPPLQSTANKKPKSNINIPHTDIIEKSSKSSVVSKKSSFKSDDWTADNDNKMQAASTEISNMVLVIQPQRTHQDHIPESAASNTVNTRLITEWIDNSSITINESQTNSIRAAMRMLVEETLDFISEPYENNCSIDSETVILSRENLSTAGLNLNFSPISFKTVITNENNSLQSDLEQAVNRSFDTTLDDSVLSLTDTRLTVTDFDLMSFKSITSVSKFSEYLSADSSQGKLPIQTFNSSSVKDIYERKDQPFAPIPQNNAGAIAIQAFSGFSINSEPIAGDKPDAINFIDSETGSMAVDVTRQANSEELFISGRSSDSFESCLIDEDSVVPSWLFQIISQQQAAEDDENRPQAHIIPLPMPDEPLFDVNGNSVEGIGLGAGAGDGRGMHSDQSQDSSGRGTSLSSSATSSGPQSEAILIDPFVAQFEGGVALLHESENSSIVVVGVNDEDNEFANIQGAAPTAPDSQSLSHGESTRRNPRPQAAVSSDVDADVSSLETDVPDSS